MSKKKEILIEKDYSDLDKILDEMVEGKRLIPFSQKIKELNIEKSLENEKRGGIYKWWAKEDVIRKILNEMDNPCSFEEIKAYLECREDDHEKYYCFYVGQAIELRKRFKNHCGNNLNKSTLRRTVGFLLKNINLPKTDLTLRDIKDRVEKTIADFMEDFYVIYYPIDGDDLSKYEKYLNPNKKTKRKKYQQVLDVFEYSAINRYLHILNIDKNEYKKKKDVDPKAKKIAEEIEKKLKEKRVKDDSEKTSD